MTAATPSHPAPARESVALPALWFGLFGAPLAWSLQLLVGYALSAHSCFPKDHLHPEPIHSTLGTVVFAISLGGAALAVAAGLTAWRSWQRTQGEDEGGGGSWVEAGEGRSRFMAIAGLLLSGIFFLGVIMNAIPLFLVPVCGVRP